jgi:Mg-chelatase subunit ChlD
VKLHTILLFLLLPVLPAAADVSFVSPPAGSQALGIQAIEVRTTTPAVNRVEFYVDDILVGVARRPPWRVVHDFGLSLSPHEVTAKVMAGGYRNLERASVRTAALAASESYNVDLVEVPLRVRADVPLREGDLRVRENDVEQTVRELKPERSAAQFVFVVDRSLSMGDGKLDAALGAIDSERRSLRNDDTAAIVLFNHNVARPRAIGLNESVRQLFAGTVPSGGTSLRDALSSLPRAARTYAIVITDGGDRNSELSVEEALRRISGRKTVVDALVLGRARSDFLDRAAANTGGEVISTSRESLRTALRKLIAGINSRYNLVYQSHGTTSGWRTISIAPSRRGIEILNARKGYFAE